MRVVVDTSAAVAAVLSRRGRADTILGALQASSFIVVTSGPLLGEMEEVLSRPDLIRSGPARLAARTLLSAVRTHADIVLIPGDVQICRDPHDDKVIETAIEGAADVLVTEDKDLLEDPAVIDALSALAVQILTLAQFLDLLDADERAT